MLSQALGGPLAVSQHSAVGVITDTVMDEQVHVLLEGLPTDSDAQGA